MGPTPEPVPRSPPMTEIAEKSPAHKAVIVVAAQHVKLTSARQPIFHKNVEKYTTEQQNEPNTTGFLC